MERIIPEHETIEIEFKSDIKKLSDSDLIDAIVAFANTHGGDLYLGVEDDGTRMQHNFQPLLPTGQSHPFRFE